MSRSLLLSSLLLLPSLATADDWPGWLGPRRDNSSTEEVKPWTGKLPEKWRVPVGEGHSSPIVAGGKVYLHSKVKSLEQEQLQCFDAASGKELWKKSYDRGRFENQFGDGPRSTPLLHDGLIYTLGVTGILTCWDAQSGDQKWQKNLLTEFKGKNLYFGISTTPLVIGDLLLVMVGAPKASLVALDRKTGDVKWQAGDDGATYASPIQWDAETALFLTAKGPRAVKAKTGDTVWFHPFMDLLNESSSTPVKAGPLAIVSSVTAGTLCLDTAKLKEMHPAQPTAQWRDGKLTCYFATPIVAGDLLFLVTGSLPPNAAANLHCADLKTGKVLWTQKKVGTYHATILRTKCKLLMLEEDGDLVLIEPDPTGFKELARGKICGTTWAHPALANGHLFIRDAHELICVGLP